MTRAARFLYIADNLKSTVTDSQVTGWLEVLQTKGIVFDLLIVPPGIRAFFRRRGERREKLRQAGRNLRGRLRQLPTVKSGSLLGNAVTFAYLLALLAPALLRRRPIVVQTRSQSYLPALRWLKRLSPRLAVVYDSRGASADEHRHASGGTGPAAEALYARMLQRQNDMIDLSDRTFCVSRKLKEYHLEKNPRLAEGKLLVVPGCADERLFRFDPAERERMRRELGLGDRRVLLYSGALDKAWQMPEQVLRLAGQLFRDLERFFFMCLTPHAELAERMAEAEAIPAARRWIGYVPYDRLPGFLAAADMGLLLREDIPLNRVASPTKFAEYVMAGLPVLISGQVGDFSGFIRESGAGIVADDRFDGLAARVAGYLDRPPRTRTEIAALGRNHFAKQKYLRALEQAYDALVSR